MTRDEARFALQGPLGEHFGHKVPEGVDDAWLDCWVALGMLKLDEPKSEPRVMMFEAIRICRAAYNDTDAFVAGLERQGFKIVEK